MIEEIEVSLLKEYIAVIERNAPSFSLSRGLGYRMFVYFWKILKIIS